VLRMLLAALASLSLSIASVGAQTPQRDLSAQRAGMSKLDALKGRWLGQGERQLPDGKSYAFTQTMDNAPAANGLVLTISGKSLRHGPADANQPGSGSFAVVTFDDRTSVYEFRSFGFGEMVPARAELVTPTAFRWTAAAGPALLRFTIDLSQPDVWNEHGERSGDGGKSWQTTNRLIAYRVETR
jgi:hypothetical protein